MEVILSVLGTGKYEPVKYKYHDRVTKESKFTITALYEIFSPEKVFVIMTNKAHETHGSELKNLIPFESIEVPDGRDYNELWQLFQKVVETIPDNAELILDVTHGFRSQPMILLAIAIYLQTVKNIKIQHIIYGAFDAKDENGNAQFFELTPFLELIQWSFAAQLFFKQGIIHPLSEILENIHQEAYQNQSNYLPKGLKNLGNNLNNLETALNSIRLKNIIEYSSNVKSIIEDDKVSKDTENLSPAKPFKLLLSKIQEQMTPFSNFNFQDIDDVIHLKIQTINYYLKVGLYQQAITVARELLVTLVCKLIPCDYIQEREKAENFINTEAEKKEEFAENFINTEAEKKEEFKELINIWKNLTSARNDINHASMRQKPIRTTTIKEHISELCREAIAIAQKFNK